MYFEELDGSHKFTHVETGAVSTRKKRDYSPISLCALIQRVAGFTLPGQKMMLWNWTPAAVLLDDVLMVTYHKNSRSIACNTHSLLHFFSPLRADHALVQGVHIRHENYGKDCSSDETSIPN